MVCFSVILERFLDREKIHDQEKRETYSFLNRLLKEFTEGYFEELDKRSATGDLVAVFDLVSEPLRYKIRLVLNALEQRVKEIPEPEGEVQKFALEFLRQILSGADVELTVGVFLSNILEQIETALPVGRRHLVSVVRKLALEE